MVFLFCSDFSQSVGVTQTIGVSARSTGSLPHTSPWDIYFLYIYHVDVHLAIYFWTRANDVFAIEHECLLIMIFTSVLIMIYISPTSWFTYHQLMCRQFSPAYVASLPRSSSIRNSWLYLASRSDLKTHTTACHAGSKAAPRQGPGIVGYPCVIRESENVCSCSQVVWCAANEREHWSWKEQMSISTIF